MINKNKEKIKKWCENLPPSGRGRYGSQYSLHLNFVETSEGCWEWSATRAPTGYGIVRYKNKHVRAHRLFWEIINGPIPKGLMGCHKCDNPPCVNPDHIFLGTASDNILDSHSKGRISQRGSANHGSKLTEKDIVKIFKIRRSGASHVALAKQFGVTSGLICLILQRKIWKHVELSLHPKGEG
jgi:hypothetical protein